MEKHLSRTATIRELLKLSNQQVIELVFKEDIKEINIKFEDDVVIRSTGKELIYSSYFWDMLRAYPKTPVISRHHVTSVLKGKPLTSSTHMELLTIINKDIVNAYALHRPEQKEPLLAMIYEVTNNIHNEVTKMAEAHVTSIDILDFIEVIEHPVIKSANDAVVATEESIAQTYQSVLNTINNDPTLSHNALVKAIKSKMVNSNQVCQCIAVRGFPTEVDGTILKTPILSNYTKGMNTLYNFVAESRSAAKALYFSEAPLQDAEYFARRLQLLAMVVERIDYNDCGTTKFLQWRVTPPEVNDKNITTYPGDLKFMVGKYYLDEESDKLKEIIGNETHLYNKVLQIRSVLFCKSKDKHAVCSTCFGALSANVTRFANLGHLCAATMTQQTSQSVLSTKHLDASSVSANFVLTGDAATFFVTNRAKNAYLIHPDIKAKKVKLSVNREEVPGLTDILSIDDAANINPIRVSSIEMVEVCYTHKDQLISGIIYVNQGNRRAVFTTEFLTFLKANRWETDGKNNFVFDLMNWDFTLPVMKLPDMEYSYSDHSHQIAKMIESSMKNITDRSTPNSPVSTLQELFGLVNTKLNVNIAALEVLIYANMLPGKDAYGLARNSDNPILGISDMVIKNRSMAAALAYEDQSVSLTSPRSFFKLDRVDGPLDAMVSPYEVVEHYKTLGNA